MHYKINLLLHNSNYVLGKNDKNYNTLENFETFVFAVKELPPGVRTLCIKCIRSTTEMFCKLADKVLYLVRT
jgi:hypothetical protein